MPAKSRSFSGETPKENRTISASERHKSTGLLLNCRKTAQVQNSVAAAIERV